MESYYFLPLVQIIITLLLVLLFKPRQISFHQAPDVQLAVASYRVCQNFLSHFYFSCTPKIKKIALQSRTVFWRTLYNLDSLCAVTCCFNALMLGIYFILYLLKS